MTKPRKLVARRRKQTPKKAEPAINNQKQVVRVSLQSQWVSDAYFNVLS